VANFLAWEGPVVVLSEGWPSWSFTLDGLNCTKLFTYCDFVSFKVKNEFLFSSLGRSHIESWSDLINVVAGQGSPIVFMQGSGSFCKTMLAKTCDLLPLSLVVVTRREEELTWSGSVEDTLVHHFEVGGMTDGAWSIRSNRNLALETSGLRRSLGMILQPVNSGKRMTEERCLKRAKSMGAIEGVDLVPAGRKRLKVLSPSVFTQDDLVLRDMLPCELMDAYDVEVTVQDALKEASRIHSVPLSLAFVLEAPGKLLTAVGQAVLKGLLNPCPLEMETKNDEANLASDKVCTPIFSVAAKALDTQVPDSVTIDPVAKEVSTEPDVEAAKEDDAAVNFGVWDKRSVENFNDTEANRGALICIKGTHCKETHGRLFDAFRVLLLRRYRHNLMRSFLKYLHEKHGNSARQTQMSIQKSSFGPWKKNEKQELVYFVSKWAARGPDNGKSGKAKQQKSKSKPKTSELD